MDTALSSGQLQQSLKHKEDEMPLHGDKKPDNWVPPDKATPELKKQLKEAAEKYPEDKKEEKKNG